MEKKPPAPPSPPAFPPPAARAPLPSPRGLLLALDAIIVLLFLLSLLQPFLLQAALMRVHAYERSMDDARVSLLMQLSQRLYNAAAAPHLNSNALLAPQNYALVGYYDPGWNRNQGDALPALADINLSSVVLDPPPSGWPPPPSPERVCLSRLMTTESGGAHALWVCDK